ncbi:MAG: alanine racemase [Planctomycetota bacterium]|nr:alanine racemase [Planctomycetota bacterium]
MQPSSAILVVIDLGVVRKNALGICGRVGVPIIGVVKANAYGLGVRQIVETIRDVVSGFCVFSLAEATRDSLWDIGGKPILSLGPSDEFDVSAFVAQHVNPSVWTIAEARRLVAARPVLCLDTGMQRFSCSSDHVEEILAAADCEQAMTHASRVEQAILLERTLGNRGLRLHAAGSGLLDEPKARLDAVRPGIALYRGATRVSARLVEAHKANGPVGYSGFTADRIGVIEGGYSNGLRKGPCLINGSRRTIREIGMQSSILDIGSGDHVGDEVILLGDGINEREVAAGWQTSEQEALLYLAGSGMRSYLPA